MVGLCIIEQQGTTLPLKPKIVCYTFFIYTLVELGDYVDNISVRGPKSELGTGVAKGAHLLHLVEENSPFVPIKDCIGDVKN